MFESYRVLKDESLESLAKKFNTTTKIIKDINNIYDDNLIREDMELVIPTETKDYYNYYTVLKGDSLYKIARKYNINPSLLAALNGLNMDDFIYPNMQILLPKVGYSYYITAEGDTIEEVIKIFNSNLEKFLKENKTIYLLPGQVLINRK